ncbi:hypothetical protein CVT26_012365 [Gymnopilus dilepis]|uniref:Uncharacterized protein n=1 Tax=Gymnopilus dilepis TaxID=231916 RepID=A0A409WMN2_9AGAR|nr:hypothetical protein CVT26_012365 [Gymnopilus dilepis]
MQLPPSTLDLQRRLEAFLNDGRGIPLLSTGSLPSFTEFASDCPTPSGISTSYVSPAQIFSTLHQELDIVTPISPAGSMRCSSPAAFAASPTSSAGLFSATSDLSRAYGRSTTPANLDNDSMPNVSPMSQRLTTTTIDSDHSMAVSESDISIMSNSLSMQLSIGSVHAHSSDVDVAEQGLLEDSSSAHSRRRRSASLSHGGNYGANTEEQEIESEMDENEDGHLSDEDDIGDNGDDSDFIPDELKDELDDAHRVATFRIILPNYSPPAQVSISGHPPSYSGINDNASGGEAAATERQTTAEEPMRLRGGVWTPDCRSGSDAQVAHALRDGVGLSRRERERAARWGPEGLGNVNDVDEHADADLPDQVFQGQESESSDLGAVYSSGGAQSSHAVDVGPIGLTLNVAGLCIPVLPGPVVPEDQILDDSALSFINSLSSIARDSLLQDLQTSNIVTNVHKVLHVLLHGWTPTPQMQLGSRSRHRLFATFQRLVAIESMDALLQLNYWVNCLQFASDVNRDMWFHRSPNQAAIYNQLSIFNYNAENGRPLDSPIPPEIQYKNLKSTASRYYSDGTKCAAFIGGGSFYILILMSAGRFRPNMRSLKGPMATRIAKLLKVPTDQPAGRLIKNNVIPAVAHLRQKYPLKFNMIFPRPFLDGLMHDGCKILEKERTLDLTDLRQSDAICDWFIVNDYGKYRDDEAWAPALVRIETERWSLDALNQLLEVPFTGNTAIPPILARHVPEEGAIAIPAPLWDSIPNIDGLVTINTAFNPKLKANQKVDYHGASREDRFQLTEKERHLAARAKVPKDFKDFSDKLKEMLKTGKRTKKTQFLRLDTKLLNGDILRINDRNDELMVLVLPHMPSYLRQDLMHTIEIIYRDVLREMDSEVAGLHHKFPAIHFQWWNRYSKRGNNPPINVDPAALQSESGQGARNSSTSIPRMSREWSEHMSAYEKLTTAFRAVFDWLEQELARLIPDTFRVISHFVDVLPANEPSPVYPFSGFVLNINVTTRIHRDWGDQDVCLLLIIRDCQGGELVLVEPGLVLDLAHGDMVLFTSSRISHLNMHFVGKRASLVFHSDKASAGWIRDRNGFQESLFMKVVDDADSDM